MLECRGSVHRDKGESNILSGYSICVAQSVSRRGGEGIFLYFVHARTRKFLRYQGSKQKFTKNVRSVVGFFFIYIYPRPFFKDWGFSYLNERKWSFGLRKPSVGGGQKRGLFLADSEFAVLKNFPKRVLEELIVDSRISRGSFFSDF